MDLAPSSPGRAIGGLTLQIEMLLPADLHPSRRPRCVRVRRWPAPGSPRAKMQRAMLRIPALAGQRIVYADRTAGSGVVSATLPSAGGLAGGEMGLGDHQEDRLADIVHLVQWPAKARAMGRGGGVVGMGVRSAAVQHQRSRPAAARTGIQIHPP